jgi:hypothetical protein
VGTGKFILSNKSTLTDTLYIPLPPIKDKDTIFVPETLLVKLPSGDTETVAIDSNTKFKDMPIYIDTRTYTEAERFIRVSTLLRGRVYEQGLTAYPNIFTANEDKEKWFRLYGWVGGGIDELTRLGVCAGGGGFILKERLSIDHTTLYLDNEWKHIALIKVWL